MAITLIKEDGTGVANANTYANAADLTAFLAQRGLDALGVDPNAAAAALVTAMDVLADKAPSYVGTPAVVGQSLAWPRVGIADPAAPYTPLPPTYMPPEIVAAQCAAAMYVLQGVNPLPVGTLTGFITSDKVGPLQTDYAMVPGASLTRPRLPLVDAYLKNITEAGAVALLVGRA